MTMDYDAHGNPLPVKCPYCEQLFDPDVGAQFRRGEILPYPIQLKREREAREAEMPNAVRRARPTPPMPPMPAAGRALLDELKGDTR